MKKKLILSSLILLNALIVASISMTIAWYGFSSSLTVDSLNISFVGEKNLLVSHTDKDFKQDITDSDFESIQSFAPVSSMYSDEWINAKSETPTFRSSFSRPDINRPGTYRNPGIAESGYFQTEVYLYSDYDVPVTLDMSEPLILPDEVRNTKTAENIIKDNPDLKLDDVKHNLDNIVKSMRVSILDPDKDNYKYTIFDPYYEVPTYLCGRMSLFSGDYYDYYKKDGEKYEFVFGEYANEDKIIYDDKVEGDSEYQDSNLPHSCFNAKTKSNVHGFNLGKSLANGFDGKLEKVTTSQTVKQDFKIHLKRKQPKRLIVSIYLEGWDLDNVNSSRFGSFVSNVKFKIGEGV